jgi:hypothetical protein
MAAIVVCLQNTWVGQYHHLGSHLQWKKGEWNKPFRNALDKSDRKKFDELFGIPRLYITACSNSVQLVPLHPIVMSILFHHYKELKKCTRKVEQMRSITGVGEGLQKKVPKESANGQLHSNSKILQISVIIFRVLQT